jgi:uncharacterized protein (TIGR02118 family)
MTIVSFIATANGSTPRSTFWANNEHAQHRLAPTVTTIKRVSAANRHPTNRSLEEFQRYWAERHGPFFSHTPNVCRYVQHITLTEAYGGVPGPTHDGVSMFWYDDLQALLNPPPSPTLVEAIPESEGVIYDWYVRSSRYGPPEKLTLAEAVGMDDRQLFDRSTEWPIAQRRISVVGSEHVVVDGQTTPSMVKAVYMVARRPGLSLAEFRSHWLEDHAELGSRLPGLRRYVLNPGIADAERVRPSTHDGFAEIWFEDLGALQEATRSEAWSSLQADAHELFADPVGLVIARERVQKNTPAGVRS